jgi:hypothetical protein
VTLFIIERNCSDEKNKPGFTNKGSSIMGGVVKKVGSAVGGIFSPAKVKPQIANKGLFDISKEVKPMQEAYNPLLQSSQQAQAAVAPQRLDVLKQMGLAATGQGPSLAEAQLKAAQDRNLAQQLAAVQAQRGGSSALNQRAMLQNMGSAGRDLAQQASIARLQERDQFLNQAQLADQGLRSDIAGKLNLDLMPKQSLQAWEQQRVGAVNQAQAQNAAAKNQLMGSLIGGAASIAGGMMGGPAGAAIGSKLGSSIGGGGGMTASANPMSSGQMFDYKFKDGGHVKAPAMADGGNVSEALLQLMCGGKVEKLAEGGFLDKIKSAAEDMRRSKYAGTAANATQSELDRKKGQGSDNDMEERKRQIKSQFDRQYKKGGEVDGPGTPTSDSIPAMLSDGEFVVKAKVVSKPAVLKFLEKLNSEKATEKDVTALAKALSKKKAKK